MVARYAPAISYNFLNLISLDGHKKTIFETRMGTIDLAVPFFGKGFNTIYPLIMVIFTLLVASNFFNRVIKFFGSWKRLTLQTEEEDIDGFDPSGLLILQRERTWLEQGRKVGEHVIPLARNFNGVPMDLESGGQDRDRDTIEMRLTSDSSEVDQKGSSSKPVKDEVRRYSGTKEAISGKYTALREQSKQASNPKPAENMASAKVSLLSAGSSGSGGSSGLQAGIASRWASMKAGFQNFKSNVESKKFLPSRQVQNSQILSRASSSESLDDIFQRLKRPSDHGNASDEDDDGMDIRPSR